MNNGYQSLFDINNAIDTAMCFAVATQISVTLIDTKGRTLYYSEQTKSECEFCTKLKKYLHFDVDCSAVNLYGAYQAERFGGKYIFYCPLGLAHFATPLMTNGEFSGALVGGPVLPSEPADYLAYELNSKFKIDKMDQLPIEEALNTVTYVSPKRLRRLSDMLYISAAYLCSNIKDYMADSARSLEIQSGISDYIESIKEINEFKSYPLEIEKELLHAIASGNKKLAGKLLNDILGHIYFSSGSSFNIIRSRTIELVVLLSRAAVEGGADAEQVLGLNYKYLAEANSFNNIEELSVWLSKIMSRFTDYVFNFSNIKHVDVIYKAVEYIKHNYMKKITLEEVSSEVYLSPTYFSKIFSEEMNETFNNYLNRVRIDNAKHLLLKNELTIVDISNIVGYEDQSYFTKVFKKLVGVSPGQFRKSRGRIKKNYTDYE